MKRKLNQVIALEKGTKQRTNDTITALHKISQQPTLFNGFSKTYRPKDEDGLVQPPQGQKVAYRAEEILDTVSKTLIGLLDVSATKDWGNQQASADIVVDGQVIVDKVPATYLLFLEKQLVTLRTFIEKMVELDDTLDWSVDPSSGLYRTDPVENTSSTKLQEPIVLYPATDKHPAQTQLITKDVVVGFWTMTKFSGALPSTRKKVLLDRVQKLLDATKVALEEANTLSIEEKRVGAAVMGYIFA